MSGPIRPEDVEGVRVAGIPEEVFAAFNELIVERIGGGNSAHFTQNDVVDRIVSKLGCPRAEVFDKKWLDVEGAFRKAGWVVEYDKPGFNESYDAYFVFRRKRNG